VRPAQGEFLSAEGHGGRVTNWGQAVLRGLVRVCYRAPWLILLLALLVWGGSLFYARQKLEMIRDRAALVKKTDRFRMLADAVKAEFPNGDDLVVVVGRGTRQQREAFIDTLSKRIRDRKDLYFDVFAKVDLRFWRSRMLFYLTQADLRLVAQNLEKAKAWLYGPPTSDSNDIGKQARPVLPVLADLALELQKSIDTRGQADYASLWQNEVLKKAQGQELKSRLRQMFDSPDFLYHSLDATQQHLLLVRPTLRWDAAIEDLQNEIRRLKPAFNDLDIGLTGKVMIQQDEVHSATRDSVQATLGSCVLVVLLFVFSFRNLWRPWMVLSALLVALGWTVGFTTLTIGHLNLLTCTFATMLIGLGVDFGIHLVYGYEDQRAEGLPPLEAMQMTMQTAGLENMVGAVTSALAFFAVCFVDFLGFQELGVIAGGGVFLCFVSMVTVLPALLFLEERYNKHIKIGDPRPRWARWLADAEDFWLARPRTTLVACGLVTAACLVAGQRVRFDHNMLNLQDNELQSIRTELRLATSGERGLLNAHFLAPNLAEARRMTTEFAKLKTVAKVDSVVSLLSPQPAGKLPWITKIAGLAGELRLPPQQNSVDAPYLQTTLAETKRALRKMREVPEAKTLLDVLQHVEKTAVEAGPGPVVDNALLFFQRVREDVEGLLQLLREQKAQPVTLDNLPFSVRLRSVGQTGKILLRIYPKENIWDHKNMGEFVKELQSIEPNVIGMPVIMYYQTEALRKAFKRSGWLALGAITVVLLVHFRSVTQTLLALVPKLIGMLWMLGMMGLAGYNFNPANFIALPLILGIGLVFGVHVVHRLLLEPHRGILRQSAGPAIALSAMATMAGFGTLMTASHQGIASLGFLMTVGVGSNLLTSLILLPCLMRLWAPAPGPSDSEIV
jgi:uncharacterized protein